MYAISHHMSISMMTTITLLLVCVIKYPLRLHLNDNIIYIETKYIFVYKVFKEYLILQKYII